MLNNMLAIFSGFKEIMIILLAILIVSLIIFILRKFPQSKYIFLALICVAIIFSGLICGYASIQYFTAEGGIIGSLDKLVNKNEVVQSNYEFDFKNMTLLYEGNDVYSARMSFEHQEEITINANDKVLLVNKKPTTLTKRGSDYIISQFGYTFYDENLEFICSDYLTIKFSFSGKVSECVVSTSGGSKMARLWTNFLQKNSFKVDIVTENLKIDETLNIEQLPEKFIYYYDFEGNLIEEYTQKITFENYPILTLKYPRDLEGDIYPCWRSSNFELVSRENLSYSCSMYDDLHFYLYNPEYAVVDIKISKELMNEFNIYYEEEREYYDITQINEFYSNFNFGYFNFKLKAIDNEEKIAKVWPMTCYVDKCQVPYGLLIAGPTSVNQLEYFVFDEEGTTLRDGLYPNITYSINNKTVNHGGIDYPMFEIKLYNKTENLETLEWSAESGYVFEDWSDKF